MSIRDFNNILKKPGCVWTVSVVSLIAMAGGVFAGFRGCGAPGLEGGSRNGNDLIVGHVGDFPISRDVMDSVLKQQLEIQKGVQLGPAELVRAYQAILTEQIKSGLMLVEAKKLGVSVNEETARQVLKDEFNQQIAMIRSQLITQGKLKSDATEADFAKVFETETKMKFSDYKSREEDRSRQMLGDPNQKMNVEAFAAGQTVAKDLAKKLRPTQSELASTFVTIKAKRVLFGPNSTDQEAKALADIKAGVPFETVIDRYTKDTTNKGKKPSETEFSLTRDMLIGMPGMDSLFKVSVGQTSQVVKIMEGDAIYKVISVKPELPKDFEKQKDQLTDSYAMTLAQNKIQQDLADLTKGDYAKFTDPGWEGIYLLSKLPAAGPFKADETATLNGIITKLRDSATSTSAKTDQKAAALAYYQATSLLYASASGDEKTKLTPDRIASIKAATQFAPSGQDDLDLAKLYADQKDVNNALMSLQKAVDDTSVVSSQSNGIIVQIEQTLGQFQQKNGVTEAQAKPIRDAVEKWTKDKQQFDAEAAENQRRQMEAQVQQAKEKADYEKKQKEIADAQKAKETKPATSGTTAPAPSASDKKSSTPSAPPIDLGLGH